MDESPNTIRSGANKTVKNPRRCPLCGSESAAESGAPLPFCTIQCKEADLGNWLTHRYAIAGPTTGDNGGGVDESWESAQGEDE